MNNCDEMKTLEIIFSAQFLTPMTLFKNNINDMPTIFHEYIQTSNNNNNKNTSTSYTLARHDHHHLYIIIV